MTVVGPDACAPDAAQVRRTLIILDERIAHARRQAAHAVRYALVTVAVTGVPLAATVWATRWADITSDPVLVAYAVIGTLAVGTFIYTGAYYSRLVHTSRDIARYTEILADVRVQHLLGHAHDIGRPRACTPASCPGLYNGYVHRPPPAERCGCDDDTQGGSDDRHGQGGGGA